MLIEDITDMMPIDTSIADGLPSALYVIMWDAMVARNPTRAAVLQALADLELNAILNHGQQPTQKVILSRIYYRGLRTADGQIIKIPLSTSSVKEINRHINKHLIPQGYVITRKDYNPHQYTDAVPRARGGPSAPWTVVAVSAYLRERIKH